MYLNSIGVIMPRGRKQTNKLLSVTDIFDKIQDLLEKKFPDLGYFEMPYCSLKYDTETKEKNGELLDIS